LYTAIDTAIHASILSYRPECFQSVGCGIRCVSEMQPSESVPLNRILTQYCVAWCCNDEDIRLAVDRLATVLIADW